MEFLIVVDMQNDFITGTLGSDDAKNIVLPVKDKIENFDGTIIFTRDSHHSDYLETKEGKRLPVEHCIVDSVGWQICDTLKPFVQDRVIIDKPTFGSVELVHHIQNIMKETNVLMQDMTFTVIGLCSDICVISNVMLLKAAFPESNVIVDTKCCAGVTPTSHHHALEAMKMCQVDLI